MAKKKEPKEGERPSLESQDDMAYLTGERSREDEEKQIKTPAPRRSSKSAKSRRRKDEEGG
ncbi:MAG: hypothetical protein M1358_17085 [Chloroflexi bacterium]|nr:hypothetical protein [Chloroflexota bacterium]